MGQNQVILRYQKFIPVLTSLFLFVPDHSALLSSPEAPELEKLSTDSESNSVDSMMDALRAVMAPVEQL